MGTINFKKSNYITLAIKPYEYESESINDYNRDFQNFDFEYSCDYENAESVLNEYNFNYFEISIESGHYESYQIILDSTFYGMFENYQEKLEAYNETKELYKMLCELAGIGFVSCYPSWNTYYNGYSETIKDIKKAIAQIRKEIKTSPTRSYYNRQMQLA